MSTSVIESSTAADEPEDRRAEPPAPRAGIVEWLTAVDHKRVGLAWFLTSLVFAGIAGFAFIGIKAELLSSGFQLLDRDNQLQLYTLGITATLYLFLLPAFIGLATYLLPLQLGVRRLAFPRLHAFAYWLYVGGGVLVAVSYLVGGGPAAARALLLQPDATLGGHASDLWIYGMIAVVGAILASFVGLVATAVTTRARGMRLDRFPVFSWSVVVAGTLVVVAAPVLLAGLVLHGINLNEGGRFFATRSGGATTIIWQHLLWIDARPELFALLILAAGAVSEVVQTFARRALLDHRAVITLIGLIAPLSLLVWAYDKVDPGAPLAPTFSIAATLPFVPLALLLLVWLGTLATGKVRPTAALALAVGFVLVLGVALIGGISGLVVPVQSGTAWEEGHFALLFVFAPLLGLSAAAYYWAPKLWGRHLLEPLGYLQFLLLVGGAVLFSVPDYAGLRDFPRFALDTGGDFTVWNRVAFAGMCLIALGLVVFVVNLAGSLLGARGRAASPDPWDAATLEWLAASPPAFDNFEPGTVPDVRSARPLVDLRNQGETV